MGAGHHQFVDGDMDQGSVSGSMRESQATGTVIGGAGAKKGRYSKRRNADGESSMYS